MDIELEKKLRHIQGNPTTGTAHNEQQIFTQVENVFMLDRLINKIEELNTTIKTSGKQSEKLEKSNNRLQMAMLILTFIATSVAVYPVLSGVLKSITSLSVDTLMLSATLLSAVAGLLSTYTEIKLIQQLYKGKANSK